MRTFNRNNTENVKQARKESKQLRKLKMSKHTIHLLDTKGDELVGKQKHINSYAEDSYEFQEY